MNDITIKTLTTLEVAEMMEIPHSDILKKLEGRKDRKGYIQILNEAQMSVVDYFIKFSYIDVKGEKRPCYEVTKLGCDFLANKFTGEKGVIFTAKYVKKFNEMEHSNVSYSVESSILKGVASAGCLIERTMKAQNCKPYEVATVLNTLFKQSGINLPDCFIKIPQYEQLTLDCVKGGVFI